MNFTLEEILQMELAVKDAEIAALKQERDALQSKLAAIFEIMGPLKKRADASLFGANPNGLIESIYAILAGHAPATPQGDL